MNLIACAHFNSLFLLCFRINTIITTQRDKVASLSLSTEDIGQPICWSNPLSPYLRSRFSSSTPWIHALNGSNINGPLTVYVLYTLLLLPLQTREHLSFNLLELKRNPNSPLPNQSLYFFFYQLTCTHGEHHMHTYKSNFVLLEFDTL